LLDILGVFRQMKRGVQRAEARDALQSQGLMSRFFLKRVGDRIDTSWKMYPPGAFRPSASHRHGDRAARDRRRRGHARRAVSRDHLAAADLRGRDDLMDTADGAFMSHAYGWAFSNPIRKVYYNITVTSLRSRWR
jgi:high-affinity nickel-transport protein